MSIDGSSVSPGMEPRRGASLPRTEADRVSAAINDGLFALSIIELIRLQRVKILTSKVISFFHSMIELE